MNNLKQIKKFYDEGIIPFCKRVLDMEFLTFEDREFLNNYASCIFSPFPRFFISFEDFTVSNKITIN